MAVSMKMTMSSGLQRRVDWYEFTSRTSPMFYKYHEDISLFAFALQIRQISFITHL
jgi:hypothetical protein